MSYRFHAKYNSRSGLLLPSGDRANDNLWKRQAGFRVDWQLSPNDQVQLSGDAYEGAVGDRFEVPRYGLPPIHRKLCIERRFREPTWRLVGHGGTPSAPNPRCKFFSTASTATICWNAVLPIVWETQNYSTNTTCRDTA